MSDPEHILYERNDAVGIITLNRPEARNAQNVDLLEVRRELNAKLLDGARRLIER